MPEFLIRLLIVVLVIWLVQVILDAIKLKDPAPRILFVLTLVVSVIWLVFGYRWIPLPSLK